MSTARPWSSTAASAWSSRIQWSCRRMDPGPFIRGCAFGGTKHVPYPRADPADTRIPRDTWATAALPVGVRLEPVGDAEAVAIAYVTAPDDPAYRGEGAG